MEMGEGAPWTFKICWSSFSLEQLYQADLFFTVYNHLTTCGWRIFSLTSSFGARDRLLISLS